MPPVNIISKSPAQSEGLTMSVSGSNDKRQLRKINGRWAKKISNNITCPSNIKNPENLEAIQSLFKKNICMPNY